MNFFLEAYMATYTYPIFLDNTKISKTKFLTMSKEIVLSYDSSKSLVNNSKVELTPVVLNKL